MVTVAQNIINNTLMIPTRAENTVKEKTTGSALMARNHPNSNSKQPKKCLASLADQWSEARAPNNDLAADDDDDRQSI